MKLQVNGKEYDVCAATVGEVLSILNYEGEWLATAVNGDLVTAADWDAFRVKEGDRIEVLAPMQGG